MKKSLLLLSAVLFLFSAGSVEPQGRKTSSYAYSTGASVPGSCTAPALFYKTSTTQGLYQCVAGSYVALVGSGTGITGSGTSGKIGKFTGTTALGNSSIDDDGSNVTLHGTLLSLQLGDTADGMANGLEIYGQTSGYLRITAPSVITGTPTFTLPAAQGAANTFPRNDGSGGLTWNKATLTTDVTGTLPVANGGTGVAATTAYALLAGGTTTTGALQSLAGVGTAGQVLTSNGASNLPTFGTASVAGGGTGLTSTTAYAVLCGGTTSTGALQSIASVGTSGQVLTSNGPNNLPTFQAAAAAGGSVSIAPRDPYPATATRTFPNVYVAAGSGVTHYSGMGVCPGTGADCATTTADSTWELNFVDIPQTLPSGTATFRLECFANAATGAMKYNWKWNTCPSGTDCSSLTLNAEGTDTITWASGGADKLNINDTTMDASTLTAGQPVVGKLVFEATGYTLAVVATCNASIVWK